MRKSIVDATNLPVAADLENGYGHAPEDAAETIRRAADVGLVGGSIEDATGDDASPIYEFDHAVERIAAAAEAAKALPFPFMLVARAENYLHGRPDLDDTIKRLQAFEKAGASVLYAPGLTQPEDIRTRLCVGDEAGECADGVEGCATVDGIATWRVGSPAHQHWVGVQPGGTDCVSACGARGDRRRHVRVCRRDAVHL